LPSGAASLDLPDAFSMSGGKGTASTRLIDFLVGNFWRGSRVKVEELGPSPVTSWAPHSGFSF
jgi:hypothetical protein